MHMVIQMIHAVLPRTVALGTIPKLHIGIVLFRLSTDTAPVKSDVLNDLSSGTILKIDFLKILLSASAIFDLIPENGPKEQDVVQEAG